MSAKLCHLTAAIFVVSGEEEFTLPHIAQLLYLIDRENIKEYSLPIVDDERLYTSMGPCHEKMYSLTIGDATLSAYGWTHLLKATDGGTLMLAKPDLTLEQLDQLSDDDLAVVRSVVLKNKHMSENELSYWLCILNNVPELAAFPTVSHPEVISVESILHATGHENAKEIAEDYQSLLESLRGLGASMGEVEEQASA